MATVTRTLRRGRTGAACLALAAAAAGCGTDTIAGGGGGGAFVLGGSAHTIDVGPLTRSYRIYVPHHRPTTPGGVARSYPLIIMLHGSSGSPDDFRSTTRMDSLSEHSRFVVVYPAGVQGGGGLFPSDWNAGGCCGAAGREQIDDVGFIRKLITEVSRQLPIDARRIYAAGFSDGGRLAHRLGCELSSTLAAVAVVSGSLTTTTCAPTKAVPLLAIHGTRDPEVAFDEPAGTPPARDVTGAGASLPPAVQFWLARNGCSAATVTRPAADVARTSFTACSGGADVQFYTIEGGTHAWPGDVGGSGAQPPMSELAASVVITQFFAKQQRR